MSYILFLVVPTGWPSLILVSHVNSTANRIAWNKVNCSQHNGLITGYTVMISNSSITYNLNSTERYIILNDLVFGTVYNISIAAVNSVGRGPFSDPIAVQIEKGICIKYILVSFILHYIIKKLILLTNLTAVLLHLVC